MTRFVYIYPNGKVTKDTGDDTVFYFDGKDGFMNVVLSNKKLKLIVIQSLQDVKKELLEMQIKEDIINSWIERFGITQLSKLTGALKVYEQQKGVVIKNKAACLYAMLSYYKNVN